MHSPLTDTAALEGRRALITDSRLFMAGFAAALFYQTLHLIEHFAQLYQHWWLGIPAFESHGIIFFFDLEWNHFAFNTLYAVALAALAVTLLRRRAHAGAFAPAAWLIYGATGIQTYHEVEHIARIFQHLSLGCEPCPGILGAYLDGVYLHFAFNAVVFLLPAVAFVLMGGPRRLLAGLRARP